MSPLIAARNRTENFLASLERQRTLGTKMLSAARTADQRQASELFVEANALAIAETHEILRLLEQAKTLADFHHALRSE